MEELLPRDAPNPLTRLLALPPDANFLVPAFLFAITLMLLFSPHYPWYVAWLVPFLTLLPNLTAFTYICGFFFLCNTAMAEPTIAGQFRLNEILYIFVLAALILEVTGYRSLTYRMPLDRIPPPWKTLSIHEVSEEVSEPS